MWRCCQLCIKKKRVTFDYLVIQKILFRTRDIYRDPFPLLATYKELVCAFFQDSKARNFQPFPQLTSSHSYQLNNSRKMCLPNLASHPLGYSYNNQILDLSLETQ